MGGRALASDSSERENRVRKSARSEAFVKTRRIVLIGCVLALAAGGYVASSRYGWVPFGAVAQAPQTKAAPRPVAVEVATAVKKLTPVQIEALGTVMPMASVVIKPRIDSEITGV